MLKKVVCKLSVGKLRERLYERYLCMMLSGPAAKRTKIAANKNVQSSGYLKIVKAVGTGSSLFTQKFIWLYLSTSCVSAEKLTAGISAL